MVVSFKYGTVSILQMEKYYIDSSIWIDFYEDRKGFQNEPLGDYAWELFSLIKANKRKIVISDLLMLELNTYYSDEEINGMMKLFAGLIEKIMIKEEQSIEAIELALKRKLPKSDVLHAILSRDNKLILITRDKHFNSLSDISKHYKPEELI